jgi:hypothetical protein
MILKKHPKIKTRFLCLAEYVESLFFYKLDKIVTRRIEIGFEDETLFIVTQRFDFFIRGERHVVYDFRNITDLAIYRSIKKYGSEDQSRYQILKNILEEGMGIVIENHGEKKLDGTIQDVRNGVKELQLLRSQVSFPFEMAIVQLITETQCVLYEHSILGQGALFCK